MQSETKTSSADTHELLRDHPRHHDTGHVGGPLATVCLLHAAMTDGAESGPNNKSKASNRTVRRANRRSTPLNDVLCISHTAMAWLSTKEAVEETNGLLRALGEGRYDLQTAADSQVRHPFVSAEHMVLRQMSQHRRVALWKKTGDVADRQCTTPGHIQSRKCRR